jgi:hypothetical protein
MSHFLQGLLEDNQFNPDLLEAATPVTSGEEMASSLRRVTSLENLQKRIHEDYEAASTFWDHEIPANAQ